MFRVVIPARYDSARLPGKALRQIGGKPMVQWVYERARAAGTGEVLIATDDVRILEAARAFGAEAVLTSADHVSGTDRIAEVAGARHWPERDIVVNLQGDEPLMPPALISQVAELLDSVPAAEVATLATHLGSVAELLDSNAVKVVTDASGRALYFSRAPIPWNRAGAASGLASQTDPGGARRHLGIYAYRVAALQAPRGARARGARGAREARATARTRERLSHSSGRRARGAGAGRQHGGRSCARCSAARRQGRGALDGGN